jgi:hypothetical protein
MHSSLDEHLYEIDYTHRSHTGVELGAKQLNIFGLNR